jgi:hypothetical protein
MRRQRTVLSKSILEALQVCPETLELLKHKRIPGQRS